MNVQETMVDRTNFSGARKPFPFVTPSTKTRHALDHNAKLLMKDLFRHLLHSPQY